MIERPLTVAWISFFPIEWLPDAPESLRDLPKLHPAPWQRILLDELKGIPGLKLHILAVRNQYPKDLSFSRKNATFHCLRLPRGMRTLSLFWWETILIRRKLRTIKPDLVQAWGTERGAALVASRLPYPYLVTMQGLLEWCLQMAGGDVFARIEARLERVSLRRASMVTAESSFAVSWLGRHYPHLELRQVEHAPNLLFHHLERRPRLKPIQFLCVGLICRLKGTDLLLQALDKLRNELGFRLTIVGSQTLGFLEHLKIATSEETWRRITFRNNLTQPEVAEELATATMVLFPTRVDNSPNSVKEAVVAGVPIVASAIGGILDYVLPGRNGVTFPAGDLDELVKAIREAVAHPLFGQGRVERQTLEQLRDYLSARVMGERFLGAYRRVLEKASTGRSKGRC